MFPSQKYRRPRKAPSTPQRFNEAGMFPSQKCRQTFLPSYLRLCFNEAGMFPSQKYICVICGAEYHPWLQ